MSVRPYREIQRRKSRQIHVGNIPVGGDAPITVQSMTNTLTADVDGTVAQIEALEAAGADIVRQSMLEKQIRLGLLTFSYDTTDCVKPNYGFHPGIFSVAQKQLSHQFIAETFLKFHIPIL